jgi:hypothetical protein
MGKTAATFLPIVSTRQFINMFIIESFISIAKKPRRILADDHYYALLLETKNYSATAMALEIERHTYMKGLLTDKEHNYLLSKDFKTISNAKRGSTIILNVQSLPKQLTFQEQRPRGRSKSPRFSLI